LLNLACAAIYRCVKGQNSKKSNYNQTYYDDKYIHDQ